MNEMAETKTVHRLRFPRDLKGFKKNYFHELLLFCWEEGPRRSSQQHSTSVSCLLYIFTIW